jgi:hypothetical protein
MIVPGVRRIQLEADHSHCTCSRSYDRLQLYLNLSMWSLAEISLKDREIFRFTGVLDFIHHLEL